MIWCAIPFLAVEKKRPQIAFVAVSETDFCMGLVIALYFTLIYFIIPAHSQF